MTRFPVSVNVTVGAISNAYKHYDNHMDDDTLERYSRAYLMYVTGTVIYEEEA